MSNHQCLSSRMVARLFSTARLACDVSQRRGRISRVTAAWLVVRKTLAQTRVAMAANKPARLGPVSVPRTTNKTSLVNGVLLVESSIGERPHGHLQDRQRHPGRILCNPRKGALCTKTRKGDHYIAASWKEQLLWVLSYRGSKP
eukprot:1182193-Prorocentrum_minimum.AAC.2